MLLGSGVGERIKNVGVIQGASGCGPLLHRLGHHIGHRHVELAAFLNGALHRFEDLLRQRRLHLVEGENVASPELVEGLNRSCRGGGAAENLFEGLQAWLGGHGEFATERQFPYPKLLPLPRFAAVDTSGAIGPGLACAVTVTTLLRI